MNASTGQGIAQQIAAMARPPYVDQLLKIHASLQPSSMGSFAQITDAIYKLSQPSPTALAVTAMQRQQQDLGRSLAGFRVLSGLTAFQTSEFERFQRTTRLITDLAASAVRSAAPLVQSSDLLKGAGIGTLPRLPGLSPVWLGALEASQATKLARYSGLDPKTFSALQVILDQTQRAGLRLAVQDSSTVLALERLVTHLPDLPKEQTNLAEEEAARAMPAAIEATETDLFAELETRLEHLEAHVSTPWYRDAETLLQILLTVIFWAVPAPGDTAFEQQVQGGQQQALTRAGQIEDRLAQIERLLREQRAAEKEVTFIVKENGNSN